MRHGLDLSPDRARGKHDGRRRGRARLAWAGLLLATPAFGADHAAAWSLLSRAPRYDAPAREDRAAPRADPFFGGRPDLVLVWFDPHTVLPRGLPVVAREVNGIFGEAGVNVGWRAGALGTTFGDGPLPEVAVILLPEDPVRRRQSQRIMGLVVREPSASRAIWVFLSNIRQVLGLDARARGAPTEIEGREVGQAVGRVVAHEIFHAIAPDEPHSANGLMHKVLDRSALLGRSIDLDDRRVRAFRTRLTALLPRTRLSGSGILPVR